MLVLADTLERVASTSHASETAARYATDAAALRALVKPAGENPAALRTLQANNTRLRGEVWVLRQAVELACAMIERGDDRLLAADGPCGNRPPDLTLDEWRDMYRALYAARQYTPAAPTSGNGGGSP